MLQNKPKSMLCVGREGGRGGRGGWRGETPCAGGVVGRDPQQPFLAKPPVAPLRDAMPMQATLDGGGWVRERTSAGRPLQAFPRLPHDRFPFTCEVCEVSFRSKQALLSNKRFAHPSERSPHDAERERPGHDWG